MLVADDPVVNLSKGQTFCEGVRLRMIEDWKTQKYVVFYYIILTNAFISTFASTERDVFSRREYSHMPFFDIVYVMLFAFTIVYEFVNFIKMHKK